MSELPLSFYPSVKSSLSLLSHCEISAIHILQLGLTQAKQCDDLTQSLLEVNRNWQILLDYRSDQTPICPGIRGMSWLSRSHDKGFLGSLPTTHPFSYSMVIVNQQQQKNAFAVEWGNLECFRSHGSACWQCQGLPWCAVLPPRQHQKGVLGTSRKGSPECLWACLTLVTGQMNYNSLSLLSLSSGYCRLPGWRGLVQGVPGV